MYSKAIANDRNNNPMIRNNGLGRFKAGGNRVKMYLSRLKANPGDQGDLGSKIGHGRKLFRRPFPEGASTRSILAPGSVSQPSTAPYCIYQVADYFQVVPLYPTTKPPAAKVVPFLFFFCSYSPRRTDKRRLQEGPVDGHTEGRHIGTHRNTDSKNGRQRRALTQLTKQGKSNPTNPWTKTLGTNPAPPPN